MVFLIILDNHNQNPLIISEVLKVTGLTGDEEALFKNENKPIKTLLLQNLELSLINKPFIQQYASLSGSTEVQSIADNSYAEYIQTNQIIDVLKLAPTKLNAQQLVDLLKPIKPRMYSIASSLTANPDEVHLTVALVENKANGESRLGTASHYLIDTLNEDDEVLVFIEENRHFKLPSQDKPVIMIGPGTGIAPFRSFLQERDETKATGENWLFFGNPHFNTDFLYQTELLGHQKNKLLTQLNVAFSRDQKHKYYVQDSLLENAASIWQWLNQKQASLYVCGDMSHMAKDVHRALVKIVSTEASLTPEQAEDYLKTLKKENRYQRDVY